MPWRMAAALAANKRMLLLRCIASCPPRFPLLPAKTVATASRCLPERVPAAALSRTAAIFFRTKFSEGYSIAQRKYFYFSPLTDAHLSDIILPFCGRGGIGIRARLRGVWETVRVQVPSTAPLSESSSMATLISFRLLQFACSLSAVCPLQTEKLRSTGRLEILFRERALLSQRKTFIYLPSCFRLMFLFWRGLTRMMAFEHRWTF